MTCSLISLRWVADHQPIPIARRTLSIVIRWLGWLLVVATAGTAAGESIELTATDLPRTIPEIALTTMSTVSCDLSGIVADVNVFVDIAHQDVGDLDIFLVRDGRQVHLFHQHGPGTQNLPSIVFDDEADQPINAASAPFASGTYQPTSLPQGGASRNLSEFDGLAAAGVWQFRIVDNWPDSEGGQLLGWSLLLSTTLVAPWPGDADRDGQVGALDAAALAHHWGQLSGAQWTDGDFNADGCVDDLDLAILAANWSVDEAEGERRVVIPEPTAGESLLLACFVLAAGTWRKTARPRAAHRGRSLTGETSP
ncbi:MAG: proprotein convertase P-domain-containing protein [Pirellulales bacterium]|nr:proprotein convertase P-domain-containing protein [Pirellulales bacterium]